MGQFNVYDIQGPENNEQWRVNICVDAITKQDYLS